MNGMSPSGTPIQAEMTGGTVPGAMTACVGCHGRDGTGNSEGGVTPTSVRWRDLVRPYDVNSPSGRRHGAYDEALVQRALTVGLDSAGNRLDAVMPRFRMSNADMADLIAWLKHIGEAMDEGLSAETIAIGSLLPSLEPGTSGAAMRDALAAYFDQMNRSGGIYGRKIVFTVASSGKGQAARLDAAKAFLDQSRPFALVASDIAGFERDLCEVLDRREIPLIGAYTPLPVVGDPPNPEVFYLDGGLRSQAEQLARFAASRASHGHIRMIVAPGEIYRQAADAAAAALKDSGWTASETASGNPVLMLSPPGGPGDPLNNAAGDILLPGLLAGGGVLNSRAARESRLYLAYPALPSDYNPAASLEYAGLAESAGLPKTFVSSQLVALASARLLMAGLTRGGRELSRGKLIAALESMWEFPTGFTPPVSFNPNRRIGFTGARIVSPDPKTGGLRVVGGAR